jgi:hypothetical protein
MKTNFKVFFCRRDSNYGAECVSLDTKSAGLQGRRFQLGSCSSLDKHNDDWDKLGRSPKSCCQLQVIENYNYLQIGSRSARHGHANPR